MRAAKQLRGDKGFGGSSTPTPTPHSTVGLGGAPMASSTAGPTDLHTNSSAADASTQRRATADPDAAAASAASGAASNAAAAAAANAANAAGPCVMGAKTGHAATVKWRTRTREMMMTNSMKRIAGRDLTVACDVGTKWGVGGRSGNVVTWSRNKNVHKGWR